MYMYYTLCIVTTHKVFKVRRFGPKSNALQKMFSKCLIFSKCVVTMRTLICEYESSIKHTQDMVFRNIKKKQTKKTLDRFCKHSFIILIYLLTAYDTFCGKGSNKGSPC